MKNKSLKTTLLEFLLLFLIDLSHELPTHATSQIQKSILLGKTKREEVVF